MKENTLKLSFEMYEELKETLIKTLRTELADHNRQQLLIRTRSSNCRFGFCNWSRHRQG